ncbi:hypothetical protein U0070_014910 [Myodes glareolus]|uniref:Uncharacterized protein n=1 Tax=Myodes glareolus TaxID=447135 RepID=A0AAW0HF34_MYOGA
MGYKAAIAKNVDDGTLPPPPPGPGIAMLWWLELTAASDRATAVTGKKKSIRRVPSSQYSMTMENSGGFTRKRGKEADRDNFHFKKKSPIEAKVSRLLALSTQGAHSCDRGVDRPLCPTRICSRISLPVLPDHGLLPSRECTLGRSSSRVSTASSLGAVQLERFRCLRRTRTNRCSRRKSKLGRSNHATAESSQLTCWTAVSVHSPPPETRAGLTLLPQYPKTLFPLPPLLPIPSHCPHSLSSSLTIPKSSQGFLSCGESKFLPPPSGSRKVSIQTGQDPKKPVHADKTRPSAIVNGFSVFIWTSGSQSAPMSATFRESGLIKCSFSPSPAGLGDGKAAGGRRCDHGAEEKCTYGGPSERYPDCRTLAKSKVKIHWTLCNQVGSSFAAETLQMQRIGHRDCGDSVVLKSISQDFSA